MTAHLSYDELKRKVEELTDELSGLKQRHDQNMETIKPFASNFVHDFNNILAAILGHTEKALDDIPNEGTARQSLRHILKATHDARDLLNQILLFSGLIEEERKPVYVDRIVNKALDDLRTTLPGNIEIKEKITEESSTILAVPSQIRKMVLNLCSNAQDAMQETGGTLSVTLTQIELKNEEMSSFSGMYQGPYLKLSVADTGQGMDSETKQRIFEPYFTTKENAKEYGLGLAVVYGIVKKHGGSIRVYSRLEEGTAVDVLLPRVDSKEEIETELQDALPAGKEQILFVDDEKVLVDLAKFNLKELGYRVDAKTSPVEALAAFRENPQKYDLVVTDMSMPNMTGEILARAIMQTRPEIPIIICTGYSELMNEEKARAIGIRDFLMKPISKRNLAKTIRLALDEKRFD